MHSIGHKRFKLIPLLWIAALTLGLVRIAAADFLVIPVPVGRALKPSAVVDLGTTSISANSAQPRDVAALSTTGANKGTYTVPQGKVLVITTVIVFPQSPGAGKISMQLIQNSSVRKFWVVTNAEPTHLHLGPGLIVAPGYSMSIKNFTSSAGSIRVNLYGYVADQE